MRVLASYEWPGNVRELENVIQRGVVLCRGSHVAVEDLGISAAVGHDPGAFDGEVRPLREAMKRVERRILMACLEACNGNRKRAAQQLAINRTTLYSKLHEHGLMDA